MKNRLLKNKNTILIIFTIMILFAWFEIRPAVIKHSCSWTESNHSLKQLAENPQGLKQKATPTEYTTCIHNYGL